MSSVSSSAAVFLALVLALFAGGKKASPSALSSRSSSRYALNSVLALVRPRIDIDDTSIGNLVTNTPRPFDHHDVEARIKKASMAFGALRDRFFGSRDVPERLKGKVYAGGVLAVLLYGCESWCLTAASIRRLSSWHNKRVREMCRVTMCQTYVHRITSKSLQQRTGVFELQHYLASRTLLWAGHVARMPKSRLPKRLLLSWVRTPRVAGGQEITFGRSLERHLEHFDLPTTFTEWATLAQDRAAWHKLVTHPPFAIGKPFVRRPRGDTR
eukprot:CAMPEP_0181268260 /NCGR_PEP_ID=MMETSP1097-20121128/5410_1 /TAXON_ID=35684 /ORGANISM="Pseudopedinella elastica, Strain CCMP716" /LENGTH=269 /DNA_ID=CAMNT_0023367885 /DNA_START=133 /DNA_END=939 /DNA_ORIENTATION=-